MMTGCIQKNDAVELSEEEKEKLEEMLIKVTNNAMRWADTIDR